VLIIDIFDYYFRMDKSRWLKQLGLRHPPPNLRRLVLTYIGNAPSSFQCWLYEISLGRLFSKFRPRISVEVRRETRADYSSLTPSELREWMEMWYVVIRYAVISFNTEIAGRSESSKVQQGIGSSKARN
jgi:hypothetical protein